MKSLKSHKTFSGVSRYRIRIILYIAIFWTIIDLLMMLLSDLEHLKSPVKGILVREIFVFIMSSILGYLFVFTLKKLFRKYPLWINFIFKSILSYRFLFERFLPTEVAQYIQYMRANPNPCLQATSSTPKCRLLRVGKTILLYLTH